MKPCPSLSYNLKASFSSFFISSNGGSSTRKVAQFSELNFSRSIFINLVEKISKLFFSGSESHCSHDLTKIISGKELYLLCVKQVKTNLQALNFISGKISQVIDLLKVNIC